ncbi:MAG: Ig-like domain-containing protein, partial [Gaiellaceae bacterium]
SAAAAAGDVFGFVVLRQGDITRRIPYGFSVTRPRLAGAQPIALRPLQSGDTRVGVDRARVYRWPTTPFGITSLFGVDQPVDEDGNETVYFIDLERRATNLGVVVVEPAPRLDAPIRSLFGANAPIHPWLLGSLDENDVQGYAGTPVNVNSFMRDFLFSIGAAGTVFPRPGRYYVAVDSGRDPFTGRSLAGRYVLRSWVDDVRPPRVQLITTRVAAGRPAVAVRVTDAGAGVDPLSLILDYRGLQIGATLFDAKTGIAVFVLPRDANELEPPDAAMRVIASDYQEAKNVNTVGENLMPNTTFRQVRPRVVAAPSVTWLDPEQGSCAAARTRLVVVASGKATISSVGFFDGKRQIARVRKNVAGVFSATWRTARAARGRHTLTAILSDTAGREARATRVVRVCA